MDAIVVPAARTSEHLRPAITLAAELRCPLVVLCSRDITASDAVSLALGNAVELVALDLAQVPAGLLPAFHTAALLAGTPFEWPTDTSLKRNLGLLLGRLVGWRRIAFVDDDITVPDPADVVRAAGLVDSYPSVGLEIGGFPDNSVVCHAYRAVGGRQETFLGGGALVVDPTAASFFPRIFNEDWFFLLNDRGLPPTALVGRAVQKAFDPFADPERARAEEFGDCLAEGVFWLLDRGGSVAEADHGFWRLFLDHRRRFVSEVAQRVANADLPGARAAPMLAALTAALDRNAQVRPDLCVTYLKEWQADRARWARHVDGVLREHRAPDDLSLPKALSELGLMECGAYLPPAPRL